MWHDGLLYKLLQINVRGNFYKVIKTLYSNSTCSIRIVNKQTQPFQYTRGVRQGCILSPLLFNIYVNDLAFSFNNILSDPFVLPNGTKLNSLFYADDLIILSRSKLGLQNCLNKLSSYCNSWMLNRIKNKIFDTMISPILTYNSEVWGAFVKSDFKSWDNSGIKKTHLHFCKRYLEVHNKSSNIACRSELGRFPLIIDINNKILNYLNYLQEKDEDSIVKKSLKISVDLYHSGQNSFYSSLNKMTDYYDFQGFNCNLLNKCKIKQYVDLMQKKYTFFNKGCFGVSSLKHRIQCNALLE